MGRTLLFLFLGGMAVWAFAASARGPQAQDLGRERRVQPERVVFVPIPVIPPSNRTGSARGPRVGGGGFSSGK